MATPHPDHRANLRALAADAPGAILGVVQADNWDRLDAMLREQHTSIRHGETRYSYTTLSRAVTPTLRGTR